MVKFSMKHAVAVTMLAGVSAAANAATQDVGIVKFDVPTSFNALVTGDAPTNLNEIVLFQPEAAAIHSGFSVMNFPITLPDDGGNFDLELATVSLSSVGADGAVGGGDDQMLKASVFTDVGNSNNLISFSYDQTLAGDQQYYLAIAGVTTGELGGALNGSIEVTPVPEPETYAMLLAGLGLMGAVVRRRGMRKTS